MFTATLMSHRQAMIRTKYVYKLTVPILGSQMLTSLLHRHCLTVIPMKAALYNTDNVF